MTSQEFTKNLGSIPKFFSIFSNHTRMPYIECDEETFLDKIFLFVDEEKAKAFVASHNKNNQSLVVATIDQQFAKNFFSSLIADGIDTICFMDEETSDLAMNQIITRTLKEGVPQPIENPALQISMMYFLQNARNIQSEEDKENAQRLEEEMMVNIARATYLMPVVPVEATDENGNNRVMPMHIKNQNEDVFIPIFTDMDEFMKMRPKDGPNQFIPISFSQIKSTKLEGIIGFVINPGSVNLQLNAQNIAAVDQRFGNQAN